MSELHPSIIALVSLAAGIASKHPNMGICQLKRLRSMGISEQQIETVTEVARYIRDEAAQQIDQSFDQIAAQDDKDNPAYSGVENSSCSTVSGSQSCC